MQTVNGRGVNAVFLIRPGNLTFPAFFIIACVNSLAAPNAV